MNIFGKLAVSALALSVASAASAASVSGSTDFRVVLPEVLVLYHWDDVVLNLTGGSIAQNDGTLTRTGTAAIGATTATIDSPAINATADALKAKMKVTLKDAWAVRNLSTATGVSLALTNPKPKLISTVDKTSFLTTTDAILKSGANSGGTLKIASGWTPVTGDIVFDLDLSQANSSGEYNTRGAAGTTGAGPVGSQATDSFVLTLTGQ